jgi:hypothetical protein
MKSYGIMVAATLGLVAIAPDAGAQRVFPTPEAAAAALVEAAKAGDRKALEAIFGPEADVVLKSGDPVDDENDRKWFVAEAAKKTTIEREDEGWAILAVGPDAWPLAIPLHQRQDGWVFDVAEGKEELLDRRVGNNELVAISVARAYVDAQREYAAEDPDGNGAHDYAGRLLSSEGKRDGLYWPAAAGETPSPFGPLVAEASDKGYRGPTKAGERVPYEGYYFKVLTAQGSHAPGGAMSYEENGVLTKGFALVAWPATYGASGVKTFVVNQLGIVFEKDLGAQTDTLAPALVAYDPDQSWSPSAD